MAALLDVAGVTVEPEQAAPEKDVAALDAALADAALAAAEPEAAPVDADADPFAAFSGAELANGAARRCKQCLPGQ